MSFIDLRYIANLLRQGFTREDVMDIIRGTHDNNMEETPTDEAGGDPPEAKPAPAARDPDPEPDPEKPRPEEKKADPHKRTEAKTVSKSFLDLLAENS